MDNIIVDLKVKKINDEYCVLWFENGVLDENKTYYTDCKQDAIETKKVMIKAYCETSLTNVVFTNNSYK